MQRQQIKRMHFFSFGFMFGNAHEKLFIDIPEPKCVVVSHRQKATSKWKLFKLWCFLAHKIAIFGEIFCHYQIYVSLRCAIWFLLLPVFAHLERDLQMFIVSFFPRSLQLLPKMEIWFSEMFLQNEWVATKNKENEAKQLQILFVCLFFGVI